MEFDSYALGLMRQFQPYSLVILDQVRVLIMHIRHVGQWHVIPHDIFELVIFQILNEPHYLDIHRLALQFVVPFD